MFIPGRMQGRADSILLSLIYGTSCSHLLPLSRDSAPLRKSARLRVEWSCSRSTPIRLITSRPSLFPLSHTRSPISSSCESRSRQRDESCRENYGC